MSTPALPITDRQGDVLVALEANSESALNLAAEPPCPLALVVLDSGEQILMGRNRWRGGGSCPVA
ncbi:hypothetical protein ET475_15600 [Microbacterium protaetiae]|uniref:Uncharacterized protein n=1 Tax=Microbacterium protaetiae TaxID=2509458 RepID=A0A4P6EG38_9MICO|nr:hypothetical protein [Microbacterium protaetiae]QAY61264.1 hypothetical protein ET475_15600 [Microbacterium protaetiae]